MQQQQQKKHKLTLQINQDTLNKANETIIKQEQEQKKQIELENKIRLSQMGVQQPRKHGLLRKPNND